MDITVVYERALGATGSIVEGVLPEQLPDPTPCPGWDVRVLLHHLIGANWMFAGVAAGGTMDAGGDMPELAAFDPSGAYNDSAAAVVDAWRQPGALDRRCHLSFGDMPARATMAIHFLDVLVHGWDLATATGRDATLDPELAAVGMVVAEGMISDALRATGAFGPAVPWPDDAPVGERLVAFTGRRP